MGKNYCIFAAQYLPHMGGVERYTYNLAKKLVERGNHVTVVTSHMDQMADHEVADGITIYRLPCIALMDGRYPVLKPNPQFWKIDSELKKTVFDLVIVNTRFYLHSIYGMYFARRQKIRCITIEHGTSHLSVHNRLLDLLEQVFEHCLTGIGRLLCQRYYGVSEACNDWLRHFHIKASGVLHNSVDPYELERIAKRKPAHFRRDHKIPDDATVLVFTGRLLREKGIPQLLEGMERLHEENRRLYLFLAGDGDLEDFVRQRKSEYVIPLGKLEFEEVICLLKESDIFCLPSFSEGFSTAMLEAAACKCYIVTTERGGAKELLLCDDYGCVLKNNDAELLYTALKSVLEDKKGRENAVNKTYAYLCEHFTWEIVADKVEKIAASRE